MVLDSSISISVRTLYVSPHVIDYFSRDVEPYSFWFEQLSRLKVEVNWKTKKIGVTH